MILPATQSAIGGVELNGILGGGTATEPAPPDNYITAEMLADAYALAANLTAEITRATAAEAELLDGYSNSFLSAITYTQNAIVNESNARVAVDNSLQTQINALRAIITSHGLS